MPTNFVQCPSVKKITALIYRLLIVSAVFVVLPIEAFALQPIAHTDVVPYQRIEYGSSFNFGVAAFSKPGIRNVSFAIASGTAAYKGSSPRISTSMALNTRVASSLTGHPGVWEYYISIPASDFSSNGTFTVTPTVTDNNSNKRILETVTLWVEGANDITPYEAWVDAGASDGAGTVGDSKDPFPNLVAAVSALSTANGGDLDYCTVYLAEGTYTLSGVSIRSTNEYFTITKEDGAETENVILYCSTTLSSGAWVYFKDITIQQLSDSNNIISSSSSDYRWFDGCRLLGSGYGRSNSNPVGISTNSSYQLWVTNTYLNNANYGFRAGTTLVRGVLMENIGNDVIGVVDDSPCVINSILDGAGHPTSGLHSDALQIYYSSAGNVLIYGYKAQNVRLETIHANPSSTAKDVALVNCLFQYQDPPYENESGEVISTSRIGGSGSPFDHLLFWHNTFIGAQGDFSSGSNYFASRQTVTNGSYIGNLFLEAQGDPTSGSNTDANYNHFGRVYGVTGSCDNGDRSDKSCPSVTYSISFGSNITTGEEDVGSWTEGTPAADGDLVDALPSNLTGVPCDIDGNERDSKPDIGALEYISSSQMPNTINAPTGVTITYHSAD